MRTVFIFAFYRILLVAAAPFFLAYVVFRGAKDRRYFSSLGERLGSFNPSTIPTIPGGIWLHAVSVGEVLSSVQLIRKMREELQVPVYVSVSTLAGRALANDKLAGVADRIFYAPLDYVFIVRRVLRLLKPSVVVIMETEIWPNLFRESKRFGCGLVVVNGRISDRAYPRYQAFRWFFRSVLPLPDRILVQSPKDADRYTAIGAPASKVHVAANLKYDFDPRATAIAPEIRKFLDQGGGRKIWIAASTMPPADDSDVDEDDAVIQAFQALHDVLLILVPRKPERFDVAAAKLRAAGVPFVRRSELSAVGGGTATVLLLDTIGELSGLFAVADVVFMGGSLARRGGHNLLEPAFFRCAAIVGPHMENFAEIAAEFSAAGACLRIPDAGGLASAVQALLDDERLRHAIGERAKTTAEAQRGATSRAIAAVRSVYEDSVPCRVRSPLSRIVLNAIAHFWILGVNLARRRNIARRRRLATPVISIGGLAMGGTGKTPLVAYIAELLHSRGVDVAILTRGYRRRDPSSSQIVQRGQSADVHVTGDEAQIFIRGGVAHVGISSDRSATGLAMEERLHPDVFLLDDGFQHARLHRDLDIVLVDSLDPFAGGVFPAGRLREPFRALQRAGVVVLTRAQPGRNYDGLRRVIEAANPSAQLFTSSVVALEWRDVESGETVPPGFFTGKRTIAFCGLGNPASFRRTLFDLCIEPEYWLTFGDHQRYGPSELDEIRRAAADKRVDAILTTEKDAINLPSTPACQVPVFFLRITVTIDHEAEFLERVSSLATRNTGPAR